jgi:N4-(beta-N-acetylglucosaminyl)-L-asparaginase
MKNFDGLDRRGFLRASAAVAVSGASGLPALAMAGAQEQPQKKTGTRPVVISSANGTTAVDMAMARLRAGDDPLDAVIAGVVEVENDPNDTSVGLGGLPNEDGIVELDASCMHGPSHKAGAVAALRNIKNPSRVARLVMQRTDHVLLVGEGALRFARAHGIPEENLLTEESRKIWLRWKESHSRDDDWLAPEELNDTPEGGPKDAIPYTHGTINCCAVDANGDLAGVTTTSGLSYKIPGRVGDSPIIGAGLYVDNAVGAAGSTGRGEANLQNCSSFQIVDEMRRGADPEAACLIVLRRVAEHTEKRLLDSQGRPKFDLKFYAVAKSGAYGGATMWSGGEYCVHDGTQSRKLKLAPLYHRESRDKNLE